MQYSGQDVFPASAELISDDSPRAAADVNVLVEAALDRTTWLYNRQSVVFITQWEDESPGGVAYASGTSYANFGNPTTNPTSVEVPGVKVGDVLLVDCSTTFLFSDTGTNDNARVRLAAEVPSVVGDVALAGAHVLFSIAGQYVPATLTGILVATQEGTYKIKLQGKTKNGSPGNIGVRDAVQLRVVVLKRG